MARSPRQLRVRRHARVRFKVHGTASRPRIAVSRSNRNISAQAIDDDARRTIAAASSSESSLRDLDGPPKDVAARVGTLLAQRAVAAGVTEAVFDRGGFKYHGRVAALADALREGGVAF